MLDIFRFSVLLLLGQFIFSAAEDECKDVCNDEKPTVDANGNILMTVWYDNDVLDDPDQWNAQMVSKACEARDSFKEKFSVEFIIGSGTRVDDNNKLICKHDCAEDRLEGCVALRSDRAKFVEFVCCNNNGGTDSECIKDLGIKLSDLEECVKKKQSDELLKANGDRRRKAGIPGCHVPEFSFNGVVDRCIKIPEFTDLRVAICEIFNRGNISVENC